MLHMTRKVLLSSVVLIATILASISSVFAQQDEAAVEPDNMFVEILQYARLDNAAYGNRTSIEKTVTAQDSCCQRRPTHPDLALELGSRLHMCSPCLNLISRWH